MPYPMWNPDKTGILVTRQAGLRFVESGPEFEQLKLVANEYDPDEKPPTGVTPEGKLAARRAAMSATRGQFLIAAVGAGIITEATAEEAAGGGWPAAFDTFLAGLPTQKRIAAKSAWVDGDRVRRNNPILALIAADQGVSPEGVDDLFRAAMAIEV